MPIKTLNVIAPAERAEILARLGMPTVDPVDYPDSTACPACHLRYVSPDETRPLVKDRCTVCQGDGAKAKAAYDDMQAVLESLWSQLKALKSEPPTPELDQELLAEIRKVYFLPGRLEQLRLRIDGALYDRGAYADD